MSRKLLIADDEEDLLETLRLRFEIEGYEVLTAANGLEALATARERSPDLILLDVMMPGENGYRVARQIRQEESASGSPSRVPIVLLTARVLSSEPGREQMFMEFSGADRMVYKPFEMEDLVQLVRELLV